MSIEADFINSFRASTTYINAHRGKVFVVLLSGEALADDNFHNIVYDLTLLHSLGIKLVLVHGARPQISNALRARGLPEEYHQQVRISNADSIHEISCAVSGLSTHIEALFSMGLANSPMAGSRLRVSRGNFVTAKPFGIHDGIDHQHTGLVRRIHADAISQQLDGGNIVLLSNLGYSFTGEVFNLTGEEVAIETAISLAAEKLILFTPEAGILDQEGQLVSALLEKDIAEHISRLCELDSEVSVCMSKALAAALHAYQNGVHRSHLISYKNNGALLQELFTREGRGSLIAADSKELIRSATVDDVAGIVRLIKPLEETGALTVRSRELLETEIEKFQVIEIENSIVACAALFPLDTHSAEVACIAIDEPFRKKGVGDKLLSLLETLAKQQSIQQLFVLTTMTDHWFLEKGFEKCTLEDLPSSRKALYNFQRNSKVLRKTL